MTLTNNNNNNNKKFNTSALDMLTATEKELYVPAVVHYLDCEMNGQGLAAAHCELEALTDMLLADGWWPWVLEMVDTAIFALHKGD